jgi:DNA-binding CsgD family transcriptional regulator
MNVMSWNGSAEFTVQQLCNRFHVSHDPLHKWLRAGQINGRKVPRRYAKDEWRVPDSELPVIERLVSGRSARIQRPAPKAKLGTDLTRRERELIDLVSQGLYKTDDLARRLSTSRSATKSRLKRLYEKLGLSERLGLLAYCQSVRQEAPKATSPAEAPTELFVDELAARFQADPAQLMRWLRKGRIQGWKVHDPRFQHPRWRVPRSELETIRALLSSEKDLLSRRERQMAGLVVLDLSNREIAERLCIGEQAVKNRLHNMFRKMAVSKRAELVLALRAAPEIQADPARDLRVSNRDTIRIEAVNAKQYVGSGSRG